MTIDEAKKLKMYDKVMYKGVKCTFVCYNNGGFLRVIFGNFFRDETIQGEYEDLLGEDTKYRLLHVADVSIVSCNCSFDCK